MPSVYQEEKRKYLYTSEKGGKNNFMVYAVLNWSQ